MYKLKVLNSEFSVSKIPGFDEELFKFINDSDLCLVSLVMKLIILCLKTKI